MENNEIKIELNCKYSLFLLETKVNNGGTFVYNYITQSCCMFLDTFDTLEEAKSAQKEYKQKTIILMSF